jgi:outer membrane protein assembly factor BamB
LAVELCTGDPVEIGGYTLESRLGSGGMGVVYLARSASGRRVAIKVVHGQYADDPEFRTRFRQEVAAARRVSGAFTAPVVDADADSERPWMGTLYIPAPTLGERVTQDGPLPPPQVRELALGLAEALRDIHRAGVVHRDLKPANVLMAHDGPRVIDFGISRAVGWGAPPGDTPRRSSGGESSGAGPLTQTGRVMGTPPYMSPEQLSRPREVTGASDIFSLGTVLAYAATGRGPFDSDSPYETATRVVEGAADLTDVPGELRPLVERCLAKAPKARPTPDEILSQLRTQTPEPPPPARARRRRPALLALAGVLVAALLALLAINSAGSSTHEEPPLSGVPAGWRPWQRTIAAPGDGFDDAAQCITARSRLICVSSTWRAIGLDPATGRTVWQHPPTENPSSIAYGPPEGHMIIGVSGGLVHAYRIASVRDDGSIAHFEMRAFDPATGAVRWSRSTADPSDYGKAVLIRNGILDVDKDGRTMRLSAADTGRSVWQRPWPGKEDDGDTYALGAAAGKALLIRVRTADNGSETTRVGKVDPATGEITWGPTHPRGLELLGTRGRALLFAERGDLPDDSPDHPYTAIVRIDPETGARLYRSPLPVRSATAPVLAGGALYTAEPTGRVIAADPDSGRKLWDVRSSVENLSPPVVSGEAVHFASDSGRLLALDRRTGEEHWATVAHTAIRTPEFEVWPRLMVVRGVAYVAAASNTVYSVDIAHPENTSGPTR